MQGTKIRLLTGGLLMLATVGYVQAEALQPDPAWQQGTLANGFQWQVLATPLGFSLEGAVTFRQYWLAERKHSAERL